MPAVREEKDDGGGTPFSLRNAGSGFEGRSSDIFCQLDALERQHITHEQNRTDLDDFADLKEDEYKNELAESETGERNISRKRDSGQEAEAPRSTESDPCSTKRNDSDHAFRRERKPGRKSDERQPPEQDPQFRRPSGRPPARHRGRGSRIPDHGKKPQSWTRYSLEDVKGSDMSEKSNTQAALAFLDERRKLREQEEGMGGEEGEAFDVGSAACSKGLFSFAKRSKTGKPSSEHGSEKLDKNKSAASAAKLATTDTEQTSEEDVRESTSSTVKEDTVQSSFKSRKGIRRNIRTRDDDD